ncbi:hypothetical protein SLA2020_466210 [Shorea laevis]
MDNLFHFRTSHTFNFSILISINILLFFATASACTIDAVPMQQSFSNLSLVMLCKSVAISGLVLFFFYTFLPGFPSKDASNLFGQFELNWSASSIRSSSPVNSPTNISHIMFVLVGSLRTWKHRKPYIEAWWRPNQTRGNIFLDFPPSPELLPWPSSSPPFIVNEDVAKLRVFQKLRSPIQVRLFRSILEAFRLKQNKDVRWYVMVDDDSLVFVDNLVEVLSKYDHTEYHYIGTNSECIKSNFDFSFDMGFGGAGYALSYPLVEALAPTIDQCIERYPYLMVSDYLCSSCLADLGVHLTQEKGFHQIDLHGDISGLLSSHPQSPLLTLHHFDTIHPLFPSKNRYESITKLMEAAKIDQSRLLQQTICYRKASNWSFSVSWGYSAYIYENIIPRSILRKPHETFVPWQRSRPPFYMFNTRWPWPPKDPCEAPHVFFLDSIEKLARNIVLTTYNRTSPRNLPPCSLSGNHSADAITQIRVLFEAILPKEAGKIECCDIEYVAGMKVAEIKLRGCRKGEVIA